MLMEVDIHFALDRHVARPARFPRFAAALFGLFRATVVLNMILPSQDSPFRLSLA